jgi:isochorismate synthase
VAGVPRPISIEFIKKNEGYNRSFYTGFIGEINRNSETELYVNLRCMQLNNGMAKLFVGGGITKDSVPEREWRETVEKTAVLGKFISY